MNYTLLKHLHVTCVVTTFLLFLVRGAWMIQGTLRDQGRWVRVVPHVIDTVLLASAIAMVILLGQYPGTAGWLTAKVIGLLLYIVFGTKALKRGRTLRARVAAFGAALAAFDYVVSLALTHDPRGILAL